MIRSKTNSLPAAVLILVSVALSIIMAVFFSAKNSQTIIQPKSDKLANLLSKNRKSLKPNIKGYTVSASTLLTPNTSQEEDLPVIHKSGTLDEDETWTAGNVYYTGYYDVVVPDGVTLTIEAGAIIKNANSGISISVSPGGTLNIEGSVVSPVIFTSKYDDSVGGDSNGDGTSSGHIGDYNSAISAIAGTVNVSHAILRNAIHSLNTVGMGQVTVEDSLLNSGVSSALVAPALERNEFTLPTSGGVALELRNISDLAPITLSGANKNEFTGTDQARIINIIGEVAANTTWDIDATSGAVLYPQALTVRGVLNLSPGTIVKNAYTATSVNIATGGEVNINGTSANHVVFTSRYDDSVGGDSNDDGSSVGATNDYSNAISMDVGATLNSTYADTKYASTAYVLRGGVSLNHQNITNVSSAVDVYAGEVDITDTSINNADYGITANNGSSTIFRGTFSNISEKAIRSCNWGQNCSVDAAYTDWGSAAGPVNSSNQSLVCGQVTVAPWVSGSSTISGGLFTSKNCDNSASPDEQVNTATQHFSDRMAARGIDCSGGFQDACDAMTTAQNCLGAATTLAASTSSFPLPNGNAYDQPAQWGNMLASNASDYIQSVEGPVPILSAANFATSLLGAISTVLNVASAYNTCAP